MRLSGQEKMGYFPTPGDLLPVLASYLSVVDETIAPRLLDPCCGQGEALASLAHYLGRDTTAWGAELSPERASVAAVTLSMVHSCAWQHCRVGRGSVSLMLLNPPYDDDGLAKTRLEQQFLEDTAHVLCEGGILIYIVPKMVLSIPQVARHLASRYNDLHIVRFPDADYAAFKQVVVFGVRKSRYSVPTDDAVSAITTWASLSMEVLPQLGLQSAPRFRVPPAPERDLDCHTPSFRRMHWEPIELLSAAQKQGVQARSKVWRDAFESIDCDVTLHPAMTLKKGHGAMLLASGLMGLMRLEHDGKTILAKGRVTKTKHTDLETAVESNGRVTEKVIEKDVFVTSVSTLEADGKLEVINDQSGLSAFMEIHGEGLGHQVISKHTPVYRFDPNASEWQAVSQVGLSMRLPGRSEGGLLAAQKHIAIAASRALKGHRVAIVNGEQGVGKSVIACGVLEVIQGYPAVVICPPHLVHKWVHEIERAITGAQARIVNCIERGNDEGALGSYTQEGASDAPEALEVSVRYSIMDFVRDYRAGKLGTKAVAVISRERAKLGSGWAPIAAVRKVWLPQESRWESYLSDPDNGQLLLDDDDLPLINNASAWKWLAAKQRFGHTEPVAGWEVASEAGKLPRRTGQWGKRETRTPLFTQGQGIGSLSGEINAEQRVGYRRYPIASFIHRKLKGFFKVLIGDEAHQFGAARSDQAIAFHQMSRACRYTLGLTGTIFGGKASSLYHLVHRTSAEMRAEFGPHDERKWSQRFGVLETTRYQSGSANAEQGEDSALSGYSRDRVVVRELPGISPAVVRYLLPHTIFARIADLGYALPPYREQVVRLEMDDQQREQYWDMVYNPRLDSGKLYTLMLDALKVGDNSLLSVWLQTALARPNSCFRQEEVERLVRLANFETPKVDVRIVSQRRQLLKRAVEYMQVMTLGPVNRPGHWLPKERWLQQYCNEQASQGRKVLVYVRQTGTRDIQPRLVEVLRAVMLRARILPNNVKPEQREAWIAANAQSMDVMIVNPQKTETGLDLIMFHSIVWFEPIYSLTTMWQAMRRVWRLGQTQPVEVIFTSTVDTLEDLALSLMGKKLYAAQMLYGDEVGGAIVESDDGNFLTELARAAMDKVKVGDLSQMFANANGGEVIRRSLPVANSEALVTTPLVSVPTTVSASILTLDDMRLMVAGTASNGRRGRVSRKAAAPAQISLLSDEMGGSLVQLGLLDN